ncbi:MAG TPA: oligosaccharide flippase family protein, partial [Methanocorpusculum sp.]|nr:oligosaccharide flippase family protein [Methanocorpusculum sp.]
MFGPIARIYNSLFQKIANIPAIPRQSIIHFTLKTSYTLVGLLATMYFSRVLGKDLLGVYYVFLTFFGLFDVTSKFGLGEAVVKRVSEGKDKNKYFSAYVSIRFILLILATLIISIAGPFIPNYDTDLTIWLIIALLAAFFGDSLITGVYSLNHVGIKNIAGGMKEFICTFTQVITVYLVVNYLVNLGYEKEFALYGLYGGFIIAIFISGFICIKYFTFKPARFTIKHIYSLLSFSIWGVLISSGFLIYKYIDNLFINSMWDPG